ncbi:hypothetical protein H634G_09263 [Metarhizium anisopliae BRIP 53293]|uniref:Uncharacterized protein n=2 Tax=Metarhizium TaxID=5529 RepID=A0A0D9NQ42_METAN|nr:hypothetical protein H634G_09263 [Metarhizium anisopliae BRIP 53293]KJK89123.1 hypothetical protein H633G_07041 [Metarhizium anisopliae BRIP 53284]
MQIKANIHECATPMKICEGMYWHAPIDLFRPCRCGKTARNKDQEQHSDVAQVLAPQKMLFRKAPKTSGTVEPKNQGAVVLGYNSIFKLRWPDRGSPEEGGDIPMEMPTEAPGGLESNFHDSAIGTSPATWATEGSEAHASASSGSAVAARFVGALDAAAPSPSGTQESAMQTEISPRPSQHAPGETSRQLVHVRIGIHSIQNASLEARIMAALIPPVFKAR